MSGRYAPLPNPLAQDAEHELDAAFESDDEDEHGSREESVLLKTHETSSERSGDPLTNAQAIHVPAVDILQRATIPGGYDFEADPFDYAVPPPGSPPGPTTFAIPNQYGNSNGLIPSNPVIPKPSRGRTGLFRRAVGALLPTHYQRVPSEDSAAHAGPARGSGTNNDGVFANMTAKPGRGIVVQEGESIHIVPEEVQKEVPPSYAVAQADSAPAYYETFVHTPSTGLDGEVLVDSMPTGSIFTFAWTMLISLSFQFIGFLLTYLLHTTHAARYGSRAGLGITIIQSAFFLRRRALLTAGSQYDDPKDAPWDNDGGLGRPDSNETAAPNAADVYPGYFSPTATEWISFFLMSLGWFVLLTSLLGFWRVKRWERGIRQANETPIPAAAQADNAVLMSRVLTVFGIPTDDDGDSEPGDPNEDLEQPPTEEDVRLRRDLRASGLL